MAFTAVLLRRGTVGDGSIREVYRVYCDAATGTLQLPTNVDHRRTRVSRPFDLSTAGTQILAKFDLSTGIISFSAAIASTGLTGVSGGVAGGQTFVATGGVVGTVVSGDANLQAQSMIVGVSGTTITVDKPLLGAIAAGNMTSACTIEIEYN